jgi:hypothetical protein
MIANHVLAFSQKRTGAGWAKRIPFRKKRRFFAHQENFPSPNWLCFAKTQSKPENEMLLKIRYASVFL